VAIKPLKKDTDSLGHIPEDRKYKISIKQSYSRVSNKLFIKTLSEDTGIQFKKTEAHKFIATWDQAEKILKIDLTKEVK